MLITENMNNIYKIFKNFIMNFILYMSKHKLLAEGTGAAYDKSLMRQKHIADNKKRKTNENKNYGYWADLARAMHIKYKVFSLGLIQKSIFDYNSGEEELYRSYVEGQCRIYEQISKLGDDREPSEKLRAVYNDIRKKRHVLAWLEHRRWTAFTRTMGYQYTSGFKKNLQLNGTHKNMELKLHPCLVEAKVPSLIDQENYMLELSGELFAEYPADFDADKLSREEMISELESKKEFLLSQNETAFRIQEKKLDLLDDLTVEWSKEAVRVSIINIDNAIKTLKTSESADVDKESRTAFLRAWQGTDRYDFKIYDYYTYDF